MNKIESSIEGNSETVKNNGADQTAQELDNHPVIQAKENKFTKTFKTLSKFIKDRIGAIKNTFNRGEKKPQEIEGASNTNFSTLDAKKANEDFIERLTGYGFQEIDYSKINLTNENSKKESHEVAKDDGDEIGEL